MHDHPPNRFSEGEYAPKPGWVGLAAVAVIMLLNAGLVCGVAWLLGWWR